MVALAKTARCVPSRRHLSARCFSIPSSEDVGTFTPSIAKIPSMFQSSIQIAGVKDLAEAQLLENLGVDFIGFPLRLGYHKPDTSEDMARTIIAGMKARAVLITYETSPRELSDFCRFLGVSIVQLHGDISSEAVQQLRHERPDLTIIKSLIVRPEFGCDAQPLLAIAGGTNLGWTRSSPTPSTREPRRAELPV